VYSGCDCASASACSSCPGISGPTPSPTNPIGYYDGQQLTIPCPSEGCCTEYTCSVDGFLNTTGNSQPSTVEDCDANCYYNCYFDENCHGQISNYWTPSPC
jgi:hypothetical protein